MVSTQVWDIEKGSESASCEEHKQLIQDIVWDHEGKVWATSSKDKKLRLGDPRSKSIVGEIDQAHAGAKSTKLSFLGGFDRLSSVGFTKQSQRQIKFWDVKKLGGEPVHQIQLDQASGVIIPYYDVDTRVLYLAGKGDGNKSPRKSKVRGCVARCSRRVCADIACDAPRAIAGHGHARRGHR